MTLLRSAQGNMYILSVIILTFILLCHSDSDFNTRARNFSIELVQSIGLDHAVICSFGVWSVMASAAIWTHGESYNQLSKTVVVQTNKSGFIEDYVKLRSTVLDFELNRTTVQVQNYSDYEKNKINIQFENFVFIYKGFNILPEFRETLTKHFKAYISRFELKELTENAKNGDAILELATKAGLSYLSYDDSNLPMIIGNLIEFNGDWTSPFQKLLTTLEKVTDSEGQQFKEKIMHKNMNVPFTYIEQIKANVIELSFGYNGKYCMLLIKPTQGVNITDSFKYLANMTLSNIMDKLQKEVNEFGLKEIDFTLPRFKMTTGVVLNKPLKDIGIDDIFISDDGHFPGISDEDIYISSVEHCAHIFCNEAGVTAYAATPGEDYSEDSLPPAVSSDPFIFFILEKPTVTVLFSGLYSRPSPF